MSQSVKPVWVTVFFGCLLWVAFINLAQASTENSLNDDSISNAWLKTIVRFQEKQLKARIGVAVLRVDGLKHADYRGNERFPLNSTHKVLACAALLRAAEQNTLNLEENIVFNKNRLVAYSPITEKFIAPKAMNLRQLCSAAISFSDNTAANLVVEKLGGPQFVNRFLRGLGDKVTQLSRSEPALNSSIPGDKRDTTTPLAVTTTLRTLLFGTALKPSSRSELTQWMRNDAVADALLRASLPQGWAIADKSGSGAYGSRSIIAAVWPKHGEAWLIAIYMTQTQAKLEQRNKAIAAIGAAVFKKMAKTE